MEKYNFNVFSQVASGVKYLHCYTEMANCMYKGVTETLSRIRISYFKEEKKNIGKKNGMSKKYVLKREKT